MENKKIVIVGSDLAAVYTAKKLARTFNRRAAVDVILISRSAYLARETSLGAVATDKLSAYGSQYDLKNIFHAQKNVRIMTDRLLSVDTANKKIVTTNGPFSYDFLILSSDDLAGGGTVPGMDQAAFRLFDLDQAIGLKNQIKASIRLGSTETDRQKRHALLTISVIGAGFSGLQLIADLAAWRPELAAENNIDASDIQLRLIDKKEHPLAVFNDRFRPKIEKFLNSENIQLTPSSEVVSAGPGYIDLLNGEKIFSSTIVWAAGETKPFLSQFLPFSANALGQLPDEAAVYLIGSRTPVDAKGLKADQTKPERLNARQSVKAVVKNTVSAVKGKSVHRQIKIKSAQRVLKLTPKRLCAKNSHSKQVTGLRARWIEKKMLLSFFWSIGSFYYFWRHLTKKDVNQHDGRQHSGLLWALAARWSLALVWLITAASLLAKNHQGLANHLPTFWLDGFLLRTDSGLPLQPLIEILCFVIAAALLLGCFTWLAAFISIGLLIFIMTNQAFVWSYIWVLPMTLAIMNGSGRVAGIDKYMLPWLGKHYDRLRYGQPRALYRDEGIK